MSVVECRVVDAGADDQLVALATANHGVLEPTFDDDLRSMTVGGRRVFRRQPILATRSSRTSRSM